MLGFVLCHKLDDNYGQHARDCVPCQPDLRVKQKFTIQNYRTAQSFAEMATITKLLLFHMCLLAYHDERDLRKKRIGKGA